MEKLKDAGIDVRFVTNETQSTRKELVNKLHDLKFSMPEETMYGIYEYCVVFFMRIELVNCDWVIFLFFRNHGSNQNMLL